VEEDFSINSNIEKLDGLEYEIKEKQAAIGRLEHEKEKKDQNKNEIEKLKVNLGELRDRYKQGWRDAKTSIGTDLFNRFTKGFIRTRDNVEENERIAHSEFLFKKLKF